MVVVVAQLLTGDLHCGCTVGLIADVNGSSRVTFCKNDTKSNNLIFYPLRVCSRHVYSKYLY